MEHKLRWFLGANTPTGLNSLYESFRRDEALERCWLLKGGPGCGKSTIMTRVAERAERAGLGVEYIHCSGDPDSLDGMYVPERRFAIFVATAPQGSVPGIKFEVFCSSGQFRTKVG